MSEKIKVHVSFPWTAMLFIVFLTLKLVGAITWSWWWVTAPLWIPLLILLVIVILFLIIDFFVKR
jgi:hypothetical protein